jgi:hypothetical protein
MMPAAIRARHYPRWIASAVPATMHWIAPYMPAAVRIRSCVTATTGHSCTLQPLAAV